ncbi:hypothetical protein FNY88_10835 [Corynebacterium guaraldiae]|uniref:DprA winged helix domain-containing protein n=1 Tax=Corynebacterium guaraldiae TaxID=3051103 RepID=A0ABY3CRN5_9CORY|nr:ABC-three component system middle component 7 [Corynebacterium guaraldiae]TRX47073.1 hypothetical protein FNY88_10835 [Corynebacterium guaraldiae]TRX53604.1 hypothetical protein FNY91_04005 [Corynebacterium guaraldiae]
MIRLPNKLYRFDESILADFVTIMRSLDTEPVSVADLHDRLDVNMAIEDIINALTLLLTLGVLSLDTDQGVISRAH